MPRGVTIQLDVPRLVRFSGKAILRLEEITGMNVLECCRQFKPAESDGSKEMNEEEQAEETASKFSFRLIVQIAQAGLVGELPHATTDDIVDLMDENGKGDGPMQRIMSFAPQVFASLSEAIGADAKNAIAVPEKSPPGRKTKKGANAGHG